MTEVVSLFVATIEQAAAIARWYVDHLHQVVMWALVADVLMWSTVGAIHLARRRRLAEAAFGQLSPNGVEGKFLPQTRRGAVALGQLSPNGVGGRFLPAER